MKNTNLNMKHEKPNLVKNLGTALICIVLLMLFGIYLIMCTDEEVCLYIGAVILGLSILMGCLVIFGILQQISINSKPINHQLCRIIEKTKYNRVIVEFDNGSREECDVAKGLLFKVSDEGEIGYKEGVIGCKQKLIVEFKKA